MKVFSFEFLGMYPVGAVAIASAETKEEAAEIFKKKLAEAGFSQDVPVEQIVEFDISKPNCEILLNGDY